ncbi:MAG: Formiminotransferase-cyclodeaminase [Thermoleophilaceae bacterium]|nr:Formiminotransferase-cyclodeaminase [Thermoleophilaceae bacterium]
MTELGKQPLSDFLAAVAAATPAPGGGTSCGVAAALAAALVEMSAGLGGRPDDAGRAGELRLRALELAEEELTSYAPVLEARTPDERSAALVAASEPPCRIVEVAADVAELGVSVAGSASAAVRGDALTGVTLAEAAAAAAARLVEINLGSGAVVERAHAAAARAATARAEGA